MVLTIDIKNNKIITEDNKEININNLIKSNINFSTYS